jgi:hypothetical protein
VLGGAGHVEGVTHDRRRLRALRAEPGAIQEDLGQSAVHVVAAERAVAARRLHLEHAVFQREDRDVERAAAEIVDRERTARILLEPVRERGGRRLVQETQDLEPREPARVLRGLPLRVVEVRGDGDDRAADVLELVLRPLLQGAQDLGAHLDRRDDLVPDTEADDVGLALLRGDELVRTEPLRLGVVASAAHEALHAHDGLARMHRRARPGQTTHDGRRLLSVGDHARQEDLLVAVLDGDWLAVRDVGDERVGRAEIDADRSGRGLGVEDVEERHGQAPAAAFARCASSTAESSSSLTSSRKRR